MIDARQLRYFVAVAEHLHFSRAADRLAVAQSALSTQIHRLEADLGVRLLNRNKRQPVTLTDAGRLFHVEAVAALRHMDRADQVGRLAARGLTGVVRIGSVASGVVSGVLTGLLSCFRNTHRDVSVEVVTLDTPRQFEAIDSGEIDIGIVRPRRQYPQGMQATIVHTERLMIALAKHHALGSRSVVSACDLERETLILPQFEEDEGFCEVLTSLGECGGFSATIDLRVKDFISAIALASAGYGVVVVPESMQQFQQPGICYRRIMGFDTTVQLALVSRKRELSPAVLAFVKHSLP